MEQGKIQEELFKLADKKYQEFHSGLCPGTNNIIGIRVPVLRNFAKEYYKTQDWEEYLKIKPVYYEETMLQGMLIGLDTKGDIDQVKEHIENFVPKIDNWAVCDTFCTGLKITKKYTKEMWKFLQKYLKSDKEFEIRFGVVMLLDYYITEEYIDKVINILDNFTHNKSIQKIRESYRVSKKDKEKLLKIKR